MKIEFLEHTSLLVRQTDFVDGNLVEQDIRENYSQGTVIHVLAMEDTGDTYDIYLTENRVASQVPKSQVREAVNPPSEEPPPPPRRCCGR